MNHEEIKIYFDLVKETESKLKIYTEALDVALKMDYSVFSGYFDECQIEYIKKDHIGFIKKMYNQAEQEYFDACASLWLAQAGFFEEKTV